MVGKMMSNAKWRGASKAAKTKFGKTMNELIAQRDAGDKGAQAKINEAVHIGGEEERAQRVAKMEADVMKDYNNRVDQNRRESMGAINRVMDAVSEASAELTGSAQYALGEIKKLGKKKKTEIAGE